MIKTLSLLSLRFAHPSKGADNSRCYLRYLLIGLFTLIASGVSKAESINEQRTSLDEELQILKKDVLRLNRDLFILEEELMFPASTQVAVFLSLDVGKFFQLDSVNIKIDNKDIANFLYTEKQVDALVRGGIQRIYLGNLKVGGHEIVAVFTGRGPNDRDYRRGASLRFEKTTDAKYLELQIRDSTYKNQPEFAIKEWE